MHTVGQTDTVFEATGVVTGYPFDFFGLKHNLYLLGTALLCSQSQGATDA